MAKQSKARDYGRSLAGIAGSNPAGAWMSVSRECCVLSGTFLVQRSPTDCGVSLCVIYKPRARGGPGPRWTVASETKKNVFQKFFCGPHNSAWRAAGWTPLIQAVHILLLAIMEIIFLAVPVPMTSSSYASANSRQNRRNLVVAYCTSLTDADSREIMRHKWQQCPTCLAAWTSIKHTHSNLIFE